MMVIKNIIKILSLNLNLQIYYIEHNYVNTTHAYKKTVILHTVIKNWDVMSFNLDNVNMEKIAISYILRILFVKQIINYIKQIYVNTKNHVNLKTANMLTAIKNWDVIIFNLDNVNMKKIVEWNILRILLQM